jgi:hypothetical protein
VLRNDAFTAMRTNQTNQLIMTTYPGFHDLPKGIKQMLQTSESFFFEESRTPPTSNALPTTLPGPVFHLPPPGMARTVGAAA